MQRLIVIALAICTGCATAPKSKEDRRELETSADATLRQMRSADPALDDVLASSAGYAVFPEIGKGGLVVGGAYGRGILYQGGHPVGYIEMNQASFGAQIGAETFSELIVFRDAHKVNDLKDGDFSLGGNMSAVALTTGAAAGATFHDGVAVFIVMRGGAMADISVSGQKINFKQRQGG